MAIFRPPVDMIVPPIYPLGPDDESHYAPTTGAIHRLMSRYAAGPRGRNVFLLNDGTITETQPNDLTTVNKVYWGACDNPVTAAEVTALQAAGYSSNIH